MFDGHADTLASYAAGNHVRETGGELAEEGEDGDLKRRGGVGVETVVGFYYYETFAGSLGGGVNAGGDGAEGGGGGG